jgi:hypothetical protein
VNLNAVVLEPPAHQRSEADDVVAVGRNEHARRAEKVAFVLPSEELLGSAVVGDTQGRCEQGEHSRAILGLERS